MDAVLDDLESTRGIDSAVANADLFEDVSPFWYSAIARTGGGVQVAPNPNFTNGSANVAWAMERLRAAGMVVIPAIADASGKGACRHAGRPSSERSARGRPCGPGGQQWLRRA